MLNIVLFQFNFKDIANIGMMYMYYMYTYKIKIKVNVLNYLNHQLLKYLKKVELVKRKNIYRQTYRTFSYFDLTLRNCYHMYTCYIITMYKINYYTMHGHTW